LFLGRTKMEMKVKKTVCLILILFLSPMVYADWNQGDAYKMHFPQMPNPFGWDICLHEQMVADDFTCTQTGPITDIHFWVSWMYNEPDWAGVSFNVQIWSNLPQGPCGGGMPGQPLWTWYGDGNFTVRQPPEIGQQGWHCPATQVTSPQDHINYWQINITDIQETFTQEKGQTYWLVIRAYKRTWPPAVGWKTSLNRYQSCSLWSIDGMMWTPVNIPGVGTVDQAFVITGTGAEVNEPKWLQKPDLSETGIDIEATEPYILADDFECNKPNLITKIVVWGSWLNDLLPANGPNNIAFTLSLHSDVPDPNVNNPFDYSMPGETLWVREFLPGTYGAKVEKAEIYEGWWSPGTSEGYLFPGDHICWKYVFDIPADAAFYQKGTPANPKVYWLDVQAHPLDTSAKFGWKTSVKHWNDNAVWAIGFEPYSMGVWNELRYPLGHVYCPNSIDLAFAIDSNNPGPQSDLGDASDSTNNSGAIMTTYPSGVTANFPTVYMDATGLPPYGPLHKFAAAAFYLGKTVTFEKEADTGPDMDLTNNIIPATNGKNLDGGDDSVAVPLKMPRCRLMKFNYLVTVVDITQPIFANVWFDFNRDGDWDDVNMCGTDAVPEWAVMNQPLGFAAPGTYTVSTPAFRTWHPTATNTPLWMRITLSETPSMSSGAGGSGPLGGYEYGETEDYHFWADQSCSNCGDYDLSGLVNYLDLREFVADWLWTGPAGGYAEGDLDCDGDVEFTDFAIFAEQWYLSCP
jgi:hypothetical protein